jgi:hypothetical protein
MSHTKLGPSLTVDESEKHESHSFWFESYKCSIKVDRRKDGGGLAVTLKTPEGKVILSVGPQDCPRFVAQIQHHQAWNETCQWASEIKETGAKFRFDYEPVNQPKSGGGSH